MWLQRFARHPRRVATRPAGRPVPRVRGLAGATLVAHGVALCVAIHLVHGYALVTRVRVELVPAAAAPPSSLPGLCATGVAKW